MSRQLTRAELRRLADPSAACCLSIYVPVGEPGGRAAAKRLRQALRRIQARLQQSQGFVPAPADGLLSAAWALASDLEHRATDHGWLVLLARPERLVIERLPGPLPELVLLGPRLHLKALLPYVPEPLGEQCLSAERYTTLAAAGSRHVRADTRQVLLAAAAGQVATVFVALDHEQWGSYDAATGLVALHNERQPADEDLLNLIALETLRHNGSVFVVPSAAMPGGASSAAILRSAAPRREASHAPLVGGR